MSRIFVAGQPSIALPSEQDAERGRTIPARRRRHTVAVDQAVVEVVEQVVGLEPQAIAIPAKGDQPIARGRRRASFFWIQSMVKDDGACAMLDQLARAITKTRAELSDTHEAVLGLTAVYHNLLPRWAEV